MITGLKKDKSGRRGSFVSKNYFAFLISFGVAGIGLWICPSFMEPSISAESKVQLKLRAERVSTRVDLEPTAFTKRRLLALNFALAFRNYTTAQSILQDLESRLSGKAQLKN